MRNGHLAHSTFRDKTSECHFYKETFETTQSDQLQMTQFYMAMAPSSRARRKISKAPFKSLSPHLLHLNTLIIPNIPTATECFTCICFRQRCYYDFYCFWYQSRHKSVACSTQHFWTVLLFIFLCCCMNCSGNFYIHH